MGSLRVGHDWATELNRTSDTIHGQNFSPLSFSQFSSVAQLCLTFCNPMNCSTPGLLIHHQLPEFTNLKLIACAWNRARRMMANDCSSEDNASGSKSSILNLDTANIWGQINLCWGQGLPVPPRTLTPLLRLCPCHARGTFPWVVTTRCLQTPSDVPWGPELPPLRSTALHQQASQVARVLTNPPTRGTGSIPGSGRCPGGGHGNPLQYSCLEKSLDRGAWRAAVHGVTKSRTQLSD